MKELKLQCSWAGAVDTGGLSKEDQARIRNIGLKKWMAEMEKKGRPKGHKF